MFIKYIARITTLIIITIIGAFLIACESTKIYSIEYANLDWVADNISNDREYVLENPEIEGFTFIGWYKNKEMTQKIEVISQGNVNNVILYAKLVKNVNLWIKSYNTYNVEYNSNGGTSIPSQTITINNPLRFPSIPYKYGYIFGGWFINSDLTGTQFLFFDTVTNNLTLYAKWIPLPTGYYTGQNLELNTTKSADSYENYYFIPIGYRFNISTTKQDALDDDMYVYIYNSNNMLIFQQSVTAYYDPDVNETFLAIPGYGYQVLEEGEMYRLVIDTSTYFTVTLTAEFLDGGYPDYQWELLDTVELIYGEHFTLPVLNNTYSWIDSAGNQITYEENSIIEFKSNVDDLYYDFYLG